MASAQALTPQVWHGEPSSRHSYLPVGSSRVSMNIVAREMEDDVPISHKYRGRYRIWPGVLLLGIIVALTVALTIHYSIEARKDAKQRDEDERMRAADAKIIDDGLPSSQWGSGSGQTYRNPKNYPPTTCAHPNYVSKNGGVYVEANGKSERIDIKGINWSGMETSNAIPYGLWDNSFNGTTVYEVVAFLARNKFNSVRLPLSVTNILGDVVPLRPFINTNTNSAIDPTSYITMLKSIIKALQYRQITVLLDIHTLDPKTPGEFWYSDAVPETDVLDSIDILTSELCSAEYWNIIGLDLKNEPHGCTWGTGDPLTDFHLAAEKLGNRMLKGCPNWLAFVEGVNDAQTVTVDNEVISFFDWWGGGLQAAGEKPVVLSIKDKVVWCPHYYSPAVSPNPYLYKSISGIQFVELEDAPLIARIKATMNQMFGYLGKESPFAIVLGEFGGLWKQDKHPFKTIQRTTHFTMKEIATNPVYSGGYIWSLNPESGYGYNPGGQPGVWQEGILELDWLHANTGYLEAIASLDELKYLKFFPCL